MKAINQPHAALKEHFGYDNFRPVQLEVIESILSEKDTVVVFRTSGGKSLCYQIPALCVEGTAIVISPLVSLMKDQVDALRERGIPSAYINSTLSESERESVLLNFQRGEYKLLYVAPERLLTPSFESAILNANVSFVAIDEAHCITVYGHDFRPAYTQIGEFFDHFEAKRGVHIPRIALTATATQKVRDDIVELSGMRNPEVFVGEFDRENIDFSVRLTDNKTIAIRELVRQYASEPMIIYCATVRHVDALYETLNKEGFNVGRYHGKLDKRAKQFNQDSFLNGSINVMIATAAFGMGVDKSNVRTVVHYHISANLEAYYQEAGRAGRDGKQSRAILLYSTGDRSIQDFFIKNTFPDQEDVFEVMNFLFSLPSELMPLDGTLEEIALMAPGTLDAYSMASVLRILEEASLIKTMRTSDSNIVTIDTLDADLHKIDFAYIGVRRSLANENLQKMISYAKTTRCRSQVILDHFGQKSEGCGRCDNCLKAANKGSKGNQVAEEYISTLLNTVQKMGKGLGFLSIKDFLQGTRTHMMERFKYTEKPEFGALSNWNTAAINQLIEAMLDKNLIFKMKNHYAITSTGEQVLNGKEKAVIYVLETVTTPSTEAAVTDESHKALIPGLTKVRAMLAKKYHYQPNQLLSDHELENIAKFMPKNMLELQMVGIPSNIFDQIGADLNKMLQVIYRNFK